MTKAMQFLPFVVGSATSKATALAMAAAMKGVRKKIHTYVVSMGEYGSTIAEAVEALGLKYQTGSPRFGELKDDGWLQFKGAQRPTSSGELAEIYIGVGEPGNCPIKSSGKTSKKIIIEDVARTLDDFRTLYTFAISRGFVPVDTLKDLGLALKKAR